MGRFVDLTGKKFGRLTVISRAKNHVTRGGHSCVQWICLCDCGCTTVVSSLSLKSGNTQSCGCLQRETAAKMLTTHGHSYDRLHGIWNHMKQRCMNPNNDSYDIYGAENKSVCSQWISNFEAFYDWAMANGYRDDLTIERIDNRMGYSPNNCRWATRKEQANNTRRTCFVVYKGEKKSLSQLADETGVSKRVLYDRIITRQWDVEKAVMTKVQGKAR